MPCQRRDLLHRRILPHYDLVQTVAVRTDQLIVGLGEDKVADLTASVDSADRLERKRVPEANVLIGCAAARSQETSMKWTPVDGLDRSLVLGELP